MISGWDDLSVIICDSCQQVFHMICEGENLTSLEIQGHVDVVLNDTSLGKYLDILLNGSRQRQQN